MLSLALAPSIRSQSIQLRIPKSQIQLLRQVTVTTQDTVTMLPTGPTGPETDTEPVAVFSTVQCWALSLAAAFASLYPDLSPHRHPIPRPQPSLLTKRETVTVHRGTSQSPPHGVLSIFFLPQARTLPPFPTLHIVVTPA